MATVADKYAMWVDLVWGYLHGRPGALPVEQYWAALDATFAVKAVSWNWKDDAEHFGVQVDRDIMGRPTEEDLRRIDELTRLHPLVAWFERTHDPKPMTVGRVPAGMVDPTGFTILNELLGPQGLEQQLSIPYELGDHSHRAFVLARPIDDFTDDELELACRIQPLLMLASRQAAVLEHAGGGAGHGLTGRELSVLRLAADGGTSQRIGHTLGISPRTVNTHLDHIYRKLGVDSRVRAVTEGQRLGLIPR